MREIILILSCLVLADSALRRHKPCVNGDQEGDKCYCKDGWTGALCHRKMNCEGYERLDNGSCVECLNGWVGPDCDTIDCNGHGEANYDFTNCTCTKPYSGDFCETFTTEHVYSYYNNMATRTGGLGVLAIIPMAAIYIICDRSARKRQAKRVEDQLSGGHFAKPEDVEEAKQGLLAEQEDMTV